MHLYDIEVSAMDGKPVQLSAFRGKVLLIVNTATHCGFTPQYDELEKLYRQYKDKGLEILDFPCNQFKEQAPGTIEEINQFCTLNFGTTFKRFAKLEVNGESEHPLYTFLKSKKGFAGFNPLHEKSARLTERMRASDPEFEKDSSIKWNFTKFLIDKNGEVVERFEPTTFMTEVEEKMKVLL
ncbi:MAG: glutathione peroxidase [Spirochaetales bacterium]|nr:glutathione peroxidase [Spirochaetales bacterium]